MSQNQTRLNNTDNNVTLTVSSVDNYMSVELNPDSINNTKYTKANAVVYQSIQRTIGGAPNATIDLSKYLKDFKKENSDRTEIVLTVTRANYDGGGLSVYTLKGAGIQLPEQRNDLSAWSAQMDSYIINIYQ